MSYEEIQELVINNLPWQIIWTVIVLIFSFLVKIPQAIFVTYKILKKNRPFMGGGHAHHYADVFLYIWHKQPKKNKISKPTSIQLTDVIPPGNVLNFENISKKTLIPMKLVKIDDEDDKIKPIKNMRNKLVICFTIFWLVLFYGDKTKYYKDMRKNIN